MSEFVRQIHLLTSLRFQNFEQITCESLDLRSMGECDVRPATLSQYLDHIWQRVEKLTELGESIVSHSALSHEMMVIVRNELLERHPAARRGLEKIHNFSGETQELRYKRRTG